MERLDRKIRIYHIDEIKLGNVLKRVKHYYNATDDVEDMFKASFRELSANEVVRNKEANIEATCQFKINKRRVEIGDFIEFERPLFGVRTYSVNSIDAYDDKNKTRYILRAVEVKVGKFDLVRWGL